MALADVPSEVETFTGTVSPGEEPAGAVTVQTVTVGQATFMAGVEPKVTVVVPGVVENPLPAIVIAVPPLTGPEAGDREVITGALPWAIITTCDELYPAASQALAGAGAHDTAPRVSSEDGMPWLDHDEPLKESATPPSVPLSSPTASQALAEVHDTLSSVPTPEGSDCCDQLEPLKKNTAPVAPIAPTASQKFADTHDTPLSWLVPDGRDWLDQDDPSKDIAISYPTAIQNPTDGHDTPFSPPIPAGRPWLDHDVPFHKRAPAGVLVLPAYPTAEQKVTDAHEMPVIGGVPEGRCWTDHEEPLKNIAIGADPDAVIPTDSQNDADAHEIELNSSTPEGIVWFDQVEPLKESTTVRKLFERLPLYPAAQQLLADIHDTAVNCSTPEGTF